ncbi:hypothetical protein BR93DRAFT_960297 [Coniochaeta sp. PMI_546]|nr:hypothetical protein BR93DRAFT_960297 [Coniochaeta sp. PMI_546]
MKPAQKKRKTLPPTKNSSSDSTNTDITVQQTKPGSEAVTNGMECVFLWGKISRYPNEPNCLAVHQPSSTITINFAPIDKGTYAFTKDFLTSNFAYFRGAFHFNDLSGRVSAEGETKHLHFDDITSQAFGRIFTYIERKARKGERYKEDRQYQAEKVRDLLVAVIVADFFLLEDFHKFEAFIAERLAYALIMNRLNLTADALFLVTEHNAFRSMIFRDVCVKAAVRPYLMESITQYAFWEGWSMYRSGFAAEYVNICSWSDIRTHYAELRQDCLWYSDAVEEAVKETWAGPLRAMERGDTNFRTSNYRDPLFDYIDSVTVCLPGPGLWPN